MNQHFVTGASALIPKPSVARELGVSSRTLSRWLVDPKVSFQSPVVIRGRNYFERGSIELWKAERVRASLKSEVA